MLKGSITTVLASNEELAKTTAEKLGKKTENNIYYRKIGDLIRSVLTPQKLLDQAEALSISSSFYLVMNQLTSLEGELALLAEASGLKGVVVPPPDKETFNKVFKELSIVNMVSDFTELDEPVSDLGYVYIDRAFNVKGVGVVVLGFALTEVRAHDKLIALPMKKEVEVKSIQVLDEDQEGVLPGTRIGFALRNVKLEDIEGVTALVKPGVKTTNVISGYTKFKWSSDATSVHVVAGGFKILATINGNEIKLNGEIPVTIKRAIILNMNAKPKTPRVYGYSLM
ncbi:translation elongation factor [Stygiolobus caldivivus]|uniref:Translation elongation factor n=1 Tax=Stygiolobus caldivivus TaxID=2824673 RepID=A0A8D5U7U9_9CREN|nr:translation elongation factor [Stygiolobus caldivivus]BCU70374.1 translation elongation factor [Stygiolobus caldivivus]